MSGPIDDLICAESRSNEIWRLYAYTTHITLKNWQLTNWTGISFKLRMDTHTNRQRDDLLSFCGVGNQNIYSTNFNEINKSKIVLLLMEEILYQLRW